MPFSLVALRHAVVSRANGCLLPSNLEAPSPLRRCRPDSHITRYQRRLQTGSSSFDFATNTFPSHLRSRVVLGRGAQTQVDSLESLLLAVSFPYPTNEVNPSSRPLLRQNMAKYESPG
ncbi:hypothetical protein GGR50DRAFT_164342 [Xylaria sp. CBS 124048]|nr:hypothetical protein GGR50DRAFT_164342 [Xylaria sp. CBS 124048]